MDSVIIEGNTQGAVGPLSTLLSLHAPREKGQTSVLFSLDMC